MERALGLPDAAQRRDAELLAFAQVLRLPQRDLAPAPGRRRRSARQQPFVERLCARPRRARRTASASWQDPRVAQDDRADADPARRAVGAVPADCRSACRRAPSRPCAIAPIASSPRASSACAPPRSSTPKSRSATTASGCTSVLHEFHLERGGRRDGRSRHGAPAWRSAQASLEYAGARRRGVPAVQRLVRGASCRATSPGCTSAKPAARPGPRGEAELRAAPEELGGVELHGRIDRIDVVDGGQPARADRLQDRQRQPAQEGRCSTVSRTPSSPSTPRSWAPRATCRCAPSTCALDSTEGLEIARACRRARERRGAGRRRRPTICVACARARPCRRSARDRPANTATRAACAGATTGRRATTRRRAASRDERARLPHRRPARRPATRSTRRRLRSGAQLRRSRPAPAPARPGCWCRACCARCSTARSRTRSSPSPSPARRPARCASACSEWLAGYSAPALDPCRTGRGAACSAASRRPGPRRSRPSSRTLVRRVLAAGRPIEIRTFHAWFAQLLRVAPLALLDRLGLAPEMELIEDFADHLPAVMRAFHAAVLRDPALRADYAAMTARARPHAAAQVARRGLVAPGRVRDGRRGRRARRKRRVGGRASGPRWRASPIRSRPCSTSSGRRACAMSPSSWARGAKTQQESPARSPPRSRSAMPAACSSAAWQALFTDKDKPRVLSKAYAGLADTQQALALLGQQVDQQDARDRASRMVRLGRALLTAFADYKRSRGHGRHGRPRALRPGAAARRRARRAGCRSGSTRASAMC